jgi:hypothetical protein
MTVSKEMPMHEYKIDHVKPIEDNAHVDLTWPVSNGTRDDSTTI